MIIYLVCRRLPHGGASYPNRVCATEADAQAYCDRMNAPAWGSICREPSTTYHINEGWLSPDSSIPVQEPELELFNDAPHLPQTKSQTR